MQDSATLQNEIVQALLGKPCWYVSCGGSVGTTFELAIGRKLARDYIVKNKAHWEEFRNFAGEANLLGWCTWRLDGPSAPLTSSDDTIEHVVKELERLVGTTVQDVR